MILLMVCDGNGHFCPVGVVVDGDVLDVDEVIEVQSELLLAEGRLLGP